MAEHPSTTDIVVHVHDLVPILDAIQDVHNEIVDALDFASNVPTNDIQTAREILSRRIVEFLNPQPAAAAEPTVAPRLPVEVARDELAYTIIHLRVDVLQDLDNYLTRIDMLINKLKDT